MDEELGNILARNVWELDWGYDNTVRDSELTTSARVSWLRLHRDR